MWVCIFGFVMCRFCVCVCVGFVVCACAYVWVF